MAADLPCIKVSTLDALAASISEIAVPGPAQESETRVVPLIDARNDRVYAAAFSHRPGALPQRHTDDAALPSATLRTQLEQTPAKLIFCGPGATLISEHTQWSAWCQARIASGHDVHAVPFEAPSPVALARISHAQVQKKDWVDAEALVPEYLAPTQAERNLNAQSNPGAR